MLTYARTRIGQFIQLARLAHIRRKVPHGGAHGRPARHFHNGKLAVTPTRRPGQLPLLFSPPSAHWCFTFKLFTQHDSIHTIQDALAYISRPQSVQAGPSGSSKANQQVTALIEALPPVLVLHLKRFLYDADMGGVVKIGKPVQFSPEFGIPLGTVFSSSSSGQRLRIHRGPVCPDIMAPVAGQAALTARYKLNGVL